MKNRQVEAIGNIRDYCSKVECDYCQIKELCTDGCLANKRFNEMVTPRILLKEIYYLRNMCNENYCYECPLRDEKGSCQKLTVDPLGWNAKAEF